MNKNKECKKLSADIEQLTKLSLRIEKNKKISDDTKECLLEFLGNLMEELDYEHRESYGYGYEDLFGEEDS